MLTEEPFLAAIIADPDDDAPRLIYADWLDEHGDSDRAEFIRIQCALNNPRNSPNDPRRPGWKTREEYLLPGQQDYWQQRLSGYSVTKVALRRGFSEEVTITAASFAEHGGELLNQAPVRGVKIMPGLYYAQDMVIAELAASPHLGRLTSLNLRGNYIGAAGVRALAASPHLARLTSLNVGYNDIGDAGAAALAAAPLLSHLTSLNLEQAGIGDAAARALAASPHLARLTSLNLSGNYIGTGGVRALAASPHLSHLTMLDLGYNDIRDAGAAALAASPHLGDLTHLYLEANAIGDAGARALANPNNNLPALTELHLGGNRIGNAVLQEIERNLQARRQRQAPATRDR